MGEVEAAVSWRERWMGNTWPVTRHQNKLGAVSLFAVCFFFIGFPFFFDMIAKMRQTPQSLILNSGPNPDPKQQSGSRKY